MMSTVTQSVSLLDSFGGNKSLLLLQRIRKPCIQVIPGPNIWFSVSNCGLGVMTKPPWEKPFCKIIHYYDQWITVQFGASFLTRASLTRSSWARPTLTRCQIGARQFGAYSSLTRGSSARFASFARCSFFTFSLHAHTFGTAQGNE